MVVHLNVLSPGVEDGVLRKLDASKVVIVDQRWIDNFHLQILQQPIEPYVFTCCNNHSSILGKDARQCYSRLFLLARSYRRTPQGQHIYRC